MSTMQKILVAYAIFIIYGTTIPFEFDFDIGYLRQRIVTVAADPLRLSRDGGLSLPDIVSNILLFVPFGFIMPYSQTRRRRTTQSLRLLLETTFAAILLSTFVECLQFFMPTRTVSLLDIMMNECGALVGAGISFLFKIHYQQRVLDYAHQQISRSPERSLFVVYATLLMVWQLAPFDVTLDVSTLKYAVKTIDMSTPASIADFGDLAAKALLYAVFSFLWLCIRLDSTRLDDVITAILLTVLFAAGVEVGQLFIISHTTKFSDLLAGLEGGLYGAAIFVLVRTRAEKYQHKMNDPKIRTSIINLALIHWLLYLLLVELHPFSSDFDVEHPTQKFGQFAWLPYIEYYNKTGVLAVTDLFHGIFKYAFPALLVFEHRRIRQLAIDHRMLISLMLLALGLSLILEIAQLFLPGRYAGLGDCINSILGVLCGYWLWGKLRRQSRENVNLALSRNSPQK